MNTKYRELVILNKLYLFYAKKNVVRCFEPIRLVFTILDKSDLPLIRLIVPSKPT
jgi:hypothetical protein